MNKFLKNLSAKNLYIVAIASVAILIIANQVVLQYLLSERSSDAVVINLAGKQRMLSQQILNLSYQAQEDPSKIDQLRSRVEEWYTVHMGLQEGNVSLDLPPLNYPELQKSFNELSPILQRVQELVNDMQSPEDVREHLAELESAVATYLPLMNQIVNQFQQLSEDHIQDLVYMEIMLALMSILILLLEVQFIFRPILKENIDRARKLEILHESKDRILATILHDLRSPLTGMQGLQSILYDELKDTLNEDQQMMFNLIEEAGNKTDLLIKELLELSILEGEDILLDMQPIRLGEYIMSTLSQFKARAKEKGVSLDMRIEGEDLIVTLDPKRFSRVLDNLLTNALKFTDNSGSVLVQTAKKDDAVIIKVSDTGIGIPKDMQEYLFDKFSKARRLGLAGENTTGLGMSIVKQIVELHKGTIWVESEKDEGTHFFIKIPINDIAA